MKIQYVRAHPNSLYGVQWRSHAIAVDKHGCLVFIVPETKTHRRFQPLPPPLQLSDRDGDDFEEIFGRFLPPKAE